MAHLKPSRKGVCREKPPARRVNRRAAWRLAMSEKEP